MGPRSTKEITTSSKVGGGTTLLLIDVQNDFHDGGSLAVPGASQDAERIADLIRHSLNDPNISPFDRIVATMDSHHKLHIAHPEFWMSGTTTDTEEVVHPDPFTLITSEDIENGKWIPREDLKLPSGGDAINTEFLNVSGNSLSLKEYCINYAKALESKKRFTLCIWPEHCLIGSTGHCVVKDVRDAMNEWSAATGGSVEWVMKGENLLTEMYSAISAEVPISPETSFNTELYESLISSDHLLIAGEALSHCVNYTTRDIIDATSKGQRHKICVLKDCATSVPSFEKEGSDFLKYVETSGATICTSIDAFNRKKRVYG